VKEFGGVGELRREIVAHFFSHRVTAIVHARADGGFKVRGLLPNQRCISPTPSQRSLQFRASPRGDAHRPLFPVDHDHRQAIRSLPQARVRDAVTVAVAHQWVIGQSRDWVDRIQCSWRMVTSASDACPSCRVPQEIGGCAQPRSLHLFGETEVQRFPAMKTGMAATSGRKAVDQPRQSLKSTGLKNSQFCIGRGPGWHALILAEHKPTGWMATLSKGFCYASGVSPSVGVSPS
jgi:hypothetical protein